MKLRFEYHVWYLLMLIACVVSAFIIPNAYLRCAGVAGFAILCHLMGQREGELVRSKLMQAELDASTERVKELERKINDLEGNAHDETFALKA
jgi:cell division protein FtsB